MNKKVKKSYHFMKLKYNSSEQEVLIRQKIMIKIVRAKALRTRKPNPKQIEKINNHARTILEYISLNGVPSSDKILFNTSLDQIGSLFATFVIVAVFTVVTFCLLV